MVSIMAVIQSRDTCSHLRDDIIELATVEHEPVKGVYKIAIPGQEKYGTLPREAEDAAKCEAECLKCPHHSREKQTQDATCTHL